MPYLDAVVKETARLLIPSNGGFRRATQDLTVGRHVIPKGAYIWWSTHLSHTLGACVIWACLPLLGNRIVSACGTSRNVVCSGPGMWVRAP